MANWITKRNITILNLVVLAVFVGTLVAVAYPFIKRGETIGPSPDEGRPSREPSAGLPEQQKTYACPKHREKTSNSPGKCPECGSELTEVDRFAMIAERDLFDAKLRPDGPPPPPPPPPPAWELVAVYQYPNKLVAVIRDKSRRNAEYVVGEGDEVPGYFGITITSITAEPALVRYHRPAVGEEELKIGEATPGVQQKGWSEVIKPVRAGYTYVVKLPELQQRIPTVEAYRGTFGLEPVTEGARVTGLRMTNLAPDNLLYAAGLKSGDVITTINGAPITDEASALGRLRSAVAQGFSIQVGIMRGRTSQTIIYTLLKK